MNVRKKTKMVSATEFTTEQYLRQANLSIDKFEYELAIKILLRSFQKEPNSLVAFKLATCLLELSNKDDTRGTLTVELQLSLQEKELVDCAQEWLEKSLTSFDKLCIPAGESVCKWQIYLSLAQLNCGEKAVEYYRESVSDLKNDVVQLNEKSQEQTNTLIRYLSNALCALCEIYMTDCW